MKSEVNIFYADDTEKELEPKFFDYLVTTESSTGKAIITIGADVKDDNICGVSLTMTKDRWLEIVQGVKEALDVWEKDSE